MPSDYYLAIDGVEGECQAADMIKNIEVDNWSFGAKTPVDLGGKGLSGGKASFSEFSCGFALDSASHQILSNLCKGTHIESVRFTGRKSGGGATPYFYLKVNMTHCLVSGFHTAGGSTGVPTAQLQVAFEKIEYEYYTQNTESGNTVLAGSASFDVKAVQAT